MSEILVTGDQVVFATDESPRALEYLQRSLPGVVITKELAQPILDLVDAGKIRIGNPQMYGGKVPVYPADNYSSKDFKIIDEWYEGLQSRT